MSGGEVVAAPPYERGDGGGEDRQNLGTKQDVVEGMEETAATAIEASVAETTCAMEQGKVLSPLGAAKDHLQEPTTAMAAGLIAVQPGGSAVAVAIGAGLRIFDFGKGEAITLLDEQGRPAKHGDSIRACGFHPSGRFFASGGDDKLLKLWDTATWQCLRTIRHPKKISALTFSADGCWVITADKFGVVHVVAAHDASVAAAEPFCGASADENADGKMTDLNYPTQLLAHYSSIITSLAVSEDGRFVVSADRDFKVRVSVFPRQPQKGAHEIQSFCLGHTQFVTCVAFVCDQRPATDMDTSGKPDSTTSAPAKVGALLVSGGGDGTVRLWAHQSGVLLDTLCLDDHYAGQCGEGEREEHEGGGDGGRLSPSNCTAKAEEDDEDEEEGGEVNGQKRYGGRIAPGARGTRAVIAMAVDHDGRSIAVALESVEAIAMLKCNFHSQKLEVIKWVSVKGNSAPTSLCWDPCNRGRLWAVSGAVEAHESGDAEMTPESTAALEDWAAAVSSAAALRLVIIDLKKKVAAQTHQRCLPFLSGAASTATSAGAASTEGGGGGGGGGEEEGVSMGEVLSFQHRSLTKDTEEISAGGEMKVSVVEGEGDGNGLGFEREDPRQRTEQGQQRKEKSLNEEEKGEEDGEGGGREQQHEIIMGLDETRFVVVDAWNLPYGKEMKAVLEGNSIDPAAAALGVERAAQAMKTIMCKRTYTEEEREKRKRMRNDKKVVMNRGGERSRRNV